MRDFKPHSYLRGKSGFTLLSFVMSLLIISLALFIMLVGEVSSRKTMARVQQRVIAQSSATELAEFFRSMKNNTLLAYLGKNPVDPTSLPYAFCADINRLDRATGVVALPDPLAGSAANEGGPENVGTMQTLNRYYRVEVIDRITREVNSKACGKTPAEFPLSPNQTLLVSVVANWVAARSGGFEEKEVQLSLLILEK